MKTKTRRRVAAATCAIALGLAAALAGTAPAAAQGTNREVTMMGLEVHLNNLRAQGFARGGVDTLADFERDVAKVRFNTGTTNALQEALNRIGVLNRAEEDLIFVNFADASARLRSFLQPLNEYMAKEPIAGFPGNWSPGMVAASTLGNQLYMIPFRCGTFMLWTNNENARTAGISGVPRTPEELYEQAKAGTFTRPNGEKVFGFLLRGDKWSVNEDFAMAVRMFGGDLVTPDMKVVINESGAVKAAEMLRRMYVEGIIPPNWATLDGGALIQLFREGRVTMAFGGSSWGAQFEGGDSKVKGIVTPSHMPLSRALWTDKVTYSPSIVWFWAIAMFKGANDKDVGYQLIRHMMKPEVQREAARNGNGPCTADLSAEMAATQPVMKLAQEIFAISRTPLPAHPRMGQVRDLIGVSVQNIVVNGVPAQAELDKAAEQIRRLLD
jgi:multiple sugar transport system substrate-binding protein